MTKFEQPWEEERKKVPHWELAKRIAKVQFGTDKMGKIRRFLITCLVWYQLKKKA